MWGHQAPWVINCVIRNATCVCHFTCKKLDPSRRVWGPPSTLYQRPSKEPLRPFVVEGHQNVLPHQMNDNWAHLFCKCLSPDAKCQEWWSKKRIGKKNSWGAEGVLDPDDVGPLVVYLDCSDKASPSPAVTLPFADVAIVSRGGVQSFIDKCL